MWSTVFPIKGGDFAHGGSASIGVRERLKRIGATPAVVRRAAIATYEAEMNVVIHARRGVMKVMLDSTRLDVDVEDRGPGIRDIGLAMKEGFSTASRTARNLGFGAGMGLPNIRKNTDSFTIDSVPGQGTRLRFAILLEPYRGQPPARNSIRVTADSCTSCRQCLRACPTGALRIRNGKPILLDPLCIDCTTCIAACRSGALTVELGTRATAKAESAVLVAQPALLSRCHPRFEAQGMLAGLPEAGYGDAYVTTGLEVALRQAVLRYARREATCRPVISPVCPSVVNLIQLRFPSLCDHVAPFLSPMETAQVVLSGHRAVFVVVCPAQYTRLTSTDPWASGEVIYPSPILGSLLQPRVPGKASDRTPMRRGRGNKAAPGAFLAASGIRHVIDVLEEAETGSLEDLAVLELWACDQGCFGSPLLRGDPFVSEHRWEQRETDLKTLARVVRRADPLLSRPGLRLDPDMGVAIQRLAQIDAIGRRLPGRDCSLCGAPTCRALAEDIAMGRADELSCVHSREKESTNENG